MLCLLSKCLQPKPQVMMVANHSRLCFHICRQSHHLYHSSSTSILSQSLLTKNQYYSLLQSSHHSFCSTTTTLTPSESDSDLETKKMIHEKGKLKVRHIKPEKPLTIDNRLPILDSSSEQVYENAWEEQRIRKEKEQKRFEQSSTSKYPFMDEEDDERLKLPIPIEGFVSPKIPNLDKKQPLTPLAEEIKRVIHSRGPITLSAYMDLCMQHPKHGYYFTKDPIGKEGDFITTPEMFSGFGECLAVWCAFTWESMGRPSTIHIIEYGPGLGTVARAILNVSRKEPMLAFRKALRIHLIETSPRLRYKQKTKLGLANIRKFKVKVKKPVYTVMDVKPYAQPQQKQEPSPIINTEKVADFEPKVMSNVLNPNSLNDSQSHSSSAPSLLKPGETVNPFATEQLLGGMSASTSAMAQENKGAISDSVKEKYAPFDWSQHNPNVVGRMDDDMKDYMSGDKHRQWMSEKNKMQSPIGTKDDSSKSKREKESGASFKVEQSSIINDESTIESSTGIPESNPFQGVMEKLMGGGMPSSSENAGPKMDFSGDILNFDDLRQSMAEEEEEIWQGRTKDGVLISWHNSLHSIDGGPALFMAHEFFDALPIHHFEFRPVGWMETVIDVNDDESNEHHFQLCRSTAPTFASAVLDRQFANYSTHQQPNIGEQMSICPAANEMMAHMSQWIKEYGGAGFIVDYGDVTPAPFTVQGVRGHKSESILSDPGFVDISTHVNFGALRSSIENIKGVKAFGPVTQSYFLQGCGIIQRFRDYLQSEDMAKKSEIEREDFIQTFGRIMDVDHIGGHFKVLGFCKENMGVPVGFRTPIASKQAKVDERGFPIVKQK